MESVPPEIREWAALASRHVVVDEDPWLLSATTETCHILASNDRGDAVIFEALPAGSGAARSAVAVAVVSMKEQGGGA